MLDFLWWKVTETDITKLKFHSWQEKKEAKVAQKLQKFQLMVKKNQKTVEKN